MGTLNPWCRNTIVCIDPPGVSLMNHALSAPPWYNRIEPSKLPDMVDSSRITWLCFATLKKHQRETKKTHTRGLTNRIQQNNKTRPCTSNNKPNIPIPEVYRWCIAKEPHFSKQPWLLYRPLPTCTSRVGYHRHRPTVRSPRRHQETAFLLHLN